MMTMHEQAMQVPSAALQSFQVGSVVVLEAGKLKLTLDQVFEPGRFSAQQTFLDASYMLVVKASDGWCWARVSGVDKDRRLVLEREAPAPEPTVKLSRKAA